MQRFCLCLLALCLLAAPSGAQSPPAAQGPDAGQLRIYVDPATGQPIDPPADQRQRAPQPEAAQAADAAVSTSHDGLTVRQGTTAAGGVLLDLEGRFQDELRIEQDANGRKLSCSHRGRPDKTP